MLLSRFAMEFISKSPTMMFATVFTLSLLQGVLALTGLAERAQNVIIGYRTCSEVLYSFAMAAFFDKMIDPSSAI